jgi:hypothetical protein
MTSDLDARAMRIGERVAEAWWPWGSSDGIAVPVGVVAALSLLGQRDPDGADLRTLLQASDDDALAGLLSEVWCHFTIARPELAFRCGPFGGWLDQDPRNETTSKAAASVARAAVKAGLLDLTLDPEMSRCVDVLGPVYTQLQSKSARSGRGEFYTPSPVCLMIAKVTMLGAEAGQSICEPAAGTGGMLRAAAQVLREEGKDPAGFEWYANDISPVAAAALAVNAHIWGLGRRVVIGCADTLAEADWPERAISEQRAAAARIGQLWQVARLRAVIGSVQALTGEAGSEAGHEQRAS